jgi:hypothetical protein
MNRQRRVKIFIPLLVLFLTTAACAFPFTGAQAIKPTATPELTDTLPSLIGTTPPSSGLVSGGSGNLSGGGNGNGSGGTGSNNGGNNGGTGGGNEIGITATATELADIYAGPYVVKQIETLGGEAISGTVCSLTQPFSVISVTPKVTFSFNFAPIDAKHGKAAYAYSIASAGESHQADGTYSIAPVDKSGTLQLSLYVSDHVVFKGFDGNIPNRYKFNLVPSTDGSCPPAP